VTKSPNPTDVHVGRRVRMRRLMLHSSQTALADALGLTFQQVQKYEKGTNRISASRLQQIASFLQVPVAFFFEDVSLSGKKSNEMRDERSLADISKFTATADGLSLIKAFMEIDDPKLRRCIVDLVEGLTSD
jgi:transcriptional regulator with XRE-family HTH domain